MLRVRQNSKTSGTRERRGAKSRQETRQRITEEEMEICVPLGPATLNPLSEESHPRVKDNLWLDVTLAWPKP